MSPLFLVVMPVLILGALAAFGVHKVAGRSLAGRTRRYTEAGAYCHGQTTDPTAYTGESLFPLSRPCNASYELVPSSVNPATALAHLSFVTPVNLNRSDTS